MQLLILGVSVSVTYIKILTIRLQPKGNWEVFNEAYITLRLFHDVTLDIWHILLGLSMADARPRSRT